ncbi:unnamed protein product [Lota lota]
MIGGGNQRNGRHLGRRRRRRYKRRSAWLTGERNAIRGIAVRRGGESSTRKARETQDEERGRYEKEFPRRYAEGVSSNANTGKGVSSAKQHERERAPSAATRRKEFPRQRYVEGIARPRHREEKETPRRRYEEDPDDTDECTGVRQSPTEHRQRGLPHK